MREIAKAIVELYSIPEKLGYNKDITSTDLLELLLLADSMREVSECLDYNSDKLESIIKRHIKPFFKDKTEKESWKLALLRSINIRPCIKCHKLKSLDSYYKDESRLDKIRGICKNCDNTKVSNWHFNNLEKSKEKSRNHYENNKQDYFHRNAIRRASKIQATPAWANLEAIKEIYRSCPEGSHVDHYYPLNSDWVCGLHVETNLQHLTAKENLTKSNKDFREDSALGAKES